MACVHIFIDGSWLYKVCGTKGVLAKQLVEPKQFRLDFGKLKETILKHVSQQFSGCTAIGGCYNVTSIFNLPSDFDTWVGRSVKTAEGLRFIQQRNIEITRSNVQDREAFSKNAVDAGFNSPTLPRVDLKDYMLPKLDDKRYQEKQVDTTVVAMLVKYAITKPSEYFAIIAGDADILPAIQIAYPEFTKNVCLVTTHPDELEASHRQTAFSYTQFQFDIKPLYLQQHVSDIMAGDHVYQCVDCKKLFSLKTPITAARQPHCPRCIKRRP